VYTDIVGHFIIVNMVLEEGLFCQTQLRATYHDLIKAVHEGHTTHAGVGDLKKVLDKVPHLMLLQREQEILGMNIYLLNWIFDFLSDRQQFLVLRGASS